VIAFDIVFEAVIAADDEFRTKPDDFPFPTGFGGTDNPPHINRAFHHGRFSAALVGG
jgi:hypothetical protein